jgi:predicted phosphodiesterase
METLELEQKIAEEISKLNLTESELKIILKNLNKDNPRQYNTAKLDYGDKHVKIGVFSDPHLGHLLYRPDVLRHAAKNFNRQNVDFIVNCGDTLEGMSGRDGHILELDKIGASAQLDYATNEFNEFGDKKVYSIESDGSHSGWFRSKGNMGLDIGKELEQHTENYIFLGYDEQDLKLDNGLRIRLTHPGSGTAYAISYKLQKYIESLGGGNKPHLLFQGHYHKAEYIFYRNIHAFDAGCLENQTLFMKKKGTPAHVGYWIVDVYVNKDGNIDRLKNEFVPFYD